MVYCVPSCVLSCKCQIFILTVYFVGLRYCVLCTFVVPTKFVDVKYSVPSKSVVLINYSIMYCGIILYCVLLCTDL